ncbi:hypothetical protein BD626DRAFT_568859 [Schizophyllum amplum]|uniref:Uncharacterized protein n=1 Tax=Schizophyllum amplum TaxID=97359 RepID=A0A550CF85_9AGAR|nr:hypothetical protein BD626DRAFT_568859 [Auriculariopsis ampla]
MPAIPSHALSTCKDMDDSPVVNHRLVSLDEGHYRRQIQHFEYYWGLQKGELHLSSPLNHIELRSDMVDKLKRREWTFMPTQETLKSMQEMALYNMTADPHSRRDCRKEFPNEEHEYDVVPLWMLKRDRPALYVNSGKNVKAFPAPYKRFPRIKSRAHPFFVAFMSSAQLDGCAAMIFSDKKARSLSDSVGRIVTCWMNEPPASFLIGPDVWKVHRHPLSDDGHAAKPALRSSRVGNMAEGSLWLESGAEGGMGYDASDLRAWIDVVARQRESDVSVWEPTWLDQEAAQDEELARYRQLAVRDAEDALHPQTTMNGGGVLFGHGVDRSGYSSNNWAMRTYRTCLWADDPWVHIKVRPL